MPATQPIVPESQDFDGMRGIPFDSVEVLQPDGSYTYDNEYYSEDFANWYRDLFSDGILIPGGTVLDTQLEVTKTGTNQVTIAPGSCIVLGRHGRMMRPYNLAITGVSEGKQRIDRVVVEMNEQERRFNLKVLQGEEAQSNPVAPEMRREEIEVSLVKYEIWQLSLAQIIVKPTGIESITDERSENELCGVSIVVPGVEKPKLPTADSAANISYDNTETGIDVDNVQQAVDYLFKVKIVTLPNSGWSEDRTQTVQVEGMKSIMTPIIDVIADTKEKSADWGKVWRVETLDGALKFYADSEIVNTLKVMVKAV